LYAPIAAGITMHFAKADALKGSLLETLKAVKTTMFLGVPRVWEKIQDKMVETAKGLSDLKKSISSWAKEVGLEAGYNEQKGKSKPWGYFFANQLVFKNVKEALGLERVRLCGTAAAPIAKETLEYFLSLNIPIYEIYGMSECCGPQSVSFPGKHKTGSCGTSIPGTELKIVQPDKDGNGEICYRGRHIFMGYMKNEKATAETIDPDGFLRSGDIGRLDADGFLYITGRIKELLITAGGENIPPVLIEDEIKRELADTVSNVMVVGDRKKFLAAVLTLKGKSKKDAAQGEYPFTDELDERAKAAFAQGGVDGLTFVTEAAKHEKVKEYLQQGIARANKRAISNAQVIQKFIVVPQDFTLETGELTITMKLKRRIVVERYNDQIEQIYAEAGNA